MSMFQDANRKQIGTRRKVDLVLHILFLVATSIGIIALMALLIQIMMDGLSRLNLDLFTNYPSRMAAKAGMKSAIVGSIYMVLIMAPISFVLGVGAAIYLEEYAKKNRLTRLIQLNISTLAGVPSIVYGILGLTIFVRGLALERSLLSGALTMTLLVLPIIIVSAQEAIRAVPRARRDASFALGATKWQTVSRSVLPSSISSIMTGVILALSRAIGETAPLVMIGALTFVAFLPESIMDQFTVMPIQIFNWVSRPQLAFHELAAAGIIVLLALLIIMNISAVILRNKYQKHI
ncbi:phosphate ABC transporter permease PstA [Paenibacillus sp. MER 180]|jgi:phosphate transport system permease protein|uniref:Phosphate transport system permease protein PstA n=3 Tax=Paenibacillus TaxID=44249 RepID=A0AAJ2JTE2_9BACL|nr:MULTISPECIES: phosphate ABC transporter permease PstA [Paenibacillus]MCM3289979.1 phosphate ABC transporter permease PstA [Paenibacillus sp. MER 180]MCY9528130.1 phosphate ABC transporter permease PstA [Paenibacillus alvei]MDT8975486.1 phosphate ABC transporter permease PstA [Paenibacillus sp. chi10]OBY77300.1 phosphate ABC transporter, permease protein PstA [Paenibacillus sp. KS1]TQR45135.1 phosphate ABC transporter permease PstA [Paenibacillus sp. SDF0028]